MFETSCKRKIRKSLNLPAQLNKLEIEKIVMNKFGSVQKVVVIEEIQDVLLLKPGLMIVGGNHTLK